MGEQAAGVGSLHVRHRLPGNHIHVLHSFPNVWPQTSGTREEERGVIDGAGATLLSWYHGIMVSWYYGGTFIWCHSVVVPWHYCVRVLCYHHASLLCCRYAMVVWHGSTMVPWCHGKVPSYLFMAVLSPVPFPPPSHPHP